jgi:hypothetical protein
MSHRCLLLVALLAAPTADAEPRVSFGAGAGMVFPNDVADGDSLYLSAELGVRLWKRLHLVPNAGYWSFSRTNCAPEVGACARGRKTSRLDLGVHLRFDIPLAERVRLFLGAGAGLTRQRLEAWGDQDWVVEGTDPSTRLLAGLEVDVTGPLAAYALLRYDLIHNAAQNEFKVLGGLRFTPGSSPDPPPASPGRP